MFKIFVLTFSFSFLLIGSSFSQKLKLRLDIGQSINYSSYRPHLFQNYFQGPISTSEYTYKKLNSFSIGQTSEKFIPQRFGISLEFNDKRNHFVFGIMLSDVLASEDRVIFNIAYKDPSTGVLVTTPSSSSSIKETVLNKIRFEYSRDYGSGIFRFSPLIGISYAWLPGVTPNSKSLSGNDIYEDIIYPNYPFTIERYTWITDYTSTMMVSAGINLSVHSKKRELFAIKLFYEQGFRAILMDQVIVNRNNKSFIYNVSYSYGSALYLKLSIPIKLYTFNKH